MDGAERRGGEKLDDEVAVGDRIHGIRRRPVEAQRLSGHGAVDGKGRAGQGGGAQGALVEPFAAILEPPAIAAEHLHIGHHMVAEGDRLGGLQMGEAGHHRVGMALRLIDQRRLKRGELLVEPVDLVAQPEADIGGDLIVARACRVQPPGGLADQGGEPRLDIHVNILEAGVEGETAALDFRLDGVEAVLDRRAVIT